MSPFSREAGLGFPGIQARCPVFLKRKTDESLGGILL